MPTQKLSLRQQLAMCIKLLPTWAWFLAAIFIDLWLTPTIWLKG